MAHRKEQRFSYQLGWVSEVVSPCKWTVFMDVTPELTEEEMVEILKAIARDGRNGAARIAAIRELRAFQAGEPVREDAIAKLYEVGKPSRTKAA